MCKETIINIQTGEILDWDKVESLPNNAMLKVNSKLWEIWDFEKNDELGYDIYKITKGSDIKAWWYCPICDDNSYQVINTKVKGTGCPICKGFYATEKNNLAVHNPTLATEWHPTLNGDITPYDVTGGSEKYWWKCIKDERHYWNTTINERKSGKGCPICKNKKVLVGVNDIATTNPELASLLLNPEDGYKYVECSTQKVDWKCPNCKEISRNKSIYDVKKRGLGCIYCSDGISYPEKVVMNLLKDLNIKFYYDKSFDWSENKRYDFYIPSNKEDNFNISIEKSIVIETHGKQHYEDSTGTFKKARSLEYEIENDFYKEEIATSNGIGRYVVIDCRISDIDYIKNNILNSQLSSILELRNINWEDIGRRSLKSKLVEVCEIYENNLQKTSGDISNEEGISFHTIIRYLKLGNKLGLCSYSPNSERTKNIVREKMSKKVVQLDFDGNLLKTYNSIADASSVFGKVKNSSISACCRGELKSTLGFMWMYKTQYDELLKNNSKPSIYKRDDLVEVAQFDLTGKFIKVYNSISDASRETNVDTSNISNCCKGVHTQAGGFIWMLKSKYDEYIKNDIPFTFEIKERTRKVVQLTLNNEFVKEWESLTEATNSIDVQTISSIQACLLGKAETAGGYRWMDVEMYHDCLKGKQKFKEPKQKFEVIQLTMDYQFVDNYDNLDEPSKKFSVQKPNIVKVCKGERKSTGGYRWMYRKDYEEQFGEIK